jgi:hypothetical protein
MGSQDVTSWASPGKSLENHVPNHQPVMDHNRILIMKNMGYMDHNNLISFFKQPFCSDYYILYIPLIVPYFPRFPKARFMAGSPQADRMDRPSSSAWAERILAIFLGEFHPC